MRYQKDKKAKNMEIREKQIENQKRTLESLKKFHEKQSRSYNEVDYTIAKRYFTKALAEFKTFGLTEEDSKILIF